jgi:hypothetical protein
MNEGFMMDAWTAMLFFRFCMRHKVHDLKDRRCVMREIVRRKKAKYLRDVSPILAGKKVLQIKSNRPKETP